MNKVATYFPQLTGLRAIAAYLIYIHHFQLSPIEPIARQLSLGVWVFFTLSGFLIYYRYANNFENTQKWWKVYAINRIARIYPLYLVLSVITLLNQSAPLVDWITNLTLTRGFFDALKFTGLKQGWSLTVEECFYFSAPFLFLAFRRNRFWSTLLGVYGIGLILIVIGRFVDFYGFFRDFNFTANYTFFGRAFDFFIGMYVAKRFMEFNHQPRQALPSARKWATATSILGICAVIYARIWLEFNIGIDYTHPLNIVLANLVMPCFFALLLWGLLTEETIVSRFLGSKLMVLLGKSSYAFYLVHLGTITNFVIVNFFNGAIKDYGALLLHFTTMNIIAILFYQLLEEPANLFIRGRLLPRPEIK